MEATAVSKINKKATDFMLLPTVDIRPPLPKLRLITDESIDQRKKSHKAKLPTHVTNLTAIAILPTEFRVKRSFTMVDKSQYASRHVRVDPRFGFKKAFREKEEKPVSPQQKAYVKENVLNSAISSKISSNQILVGNPVNLKLDRSRTDLIQGQTSFRHTSRSRSSFHSRYIPKDTEFLLTSSNDSGSSFVSSSRYKQITSESTSLPALSKNFADSTQSTDSMGPQSVYFKNNKYDLVKILNANGIFSQETSLVISSSRKSAYGRGPKQYVIKRLPILEGNKKETVTKIYENFNDLNGFKLNPNLNRLVDTYLSNDLRFFFIIQEYYGTNLEKYLTETKSKNEVVSSSLSISWFRQIINGVRYLHETCQLLHGNIKPTNILFSKYCSIEFLYLYVDLSSTNFFHYLKDNDMTSLKLADFGYINLFNKFKFIIKIINDPVNKLYLPLETFKSYKYSFKSEIYSIGAICYEILYLENLSLQQSGTRRLESYDSHLVVDGTDKFNHILQAMLSNAEMNRPNMTDISKFLAWQNSVQYMNGLERIKSYFGFSSTSLGYLIKWRQQKITKENATNISNKIYVLKQFSFSSNKMQVLQETLPGLLKSKLDHQNLLCATNYLLIHTRLLVINDYLSVEDEYLNLEQKLKSCKEFLCDHFTEGLIVAKWLPQIIDPLEYLHSKNIIHGNLKPDNVFINSKNFVKLTDFGFYHHLYEKSDTCESFNPYSSQKSENDESLIFKTPLELTKNGFVPVSYKLDIYMLGMVLYRCLTYDEWPEVARDIFKENKFSQNGNRCVIKLRKLILNMINPEPCDRPELKTVLSTLNSKIEYKFPNNLFDASLITGVGNSVARINGRVLNFFNRERDFIMVRTFRKQSFRTFIDWQCLKSNQILLYSTLSFI
jgi:serine/threonine protein kinase